MAPLCAPRQSKSRGRSYCQVEGCTARLSKAYCLRYRVCQVHLTAPCVELHGSRVRFCQKCGRFEALDAFDGTKRSCREQLAAHNVARRERRREAAVQQSEAEQLSLQGALGARRAAAGARQGSHSTCSNATASSADGALTVCSGDGRRSSASVSSHATAAQGAWCASESAAAQLFSDVWTATSADVAWRQAPASPPQLAARAAWHGVAPPSLPQQSEPCSSGHQQLSQARSGSVDSGVSACFFNEAPDLLSPGGSTACGLGPCCAEPLLSSYKQRWELQPQQPQQPQQLQLPRLLPEHEAQLAPPAAPPAGAAPGAGPALAACPRSAWDDVLDWLLDDDAVDEPLMDAAQACALAAGLAA
ncbi:SPL3 [Scenedesmus sp. PABB004]|nr:SPL3 [Scenedesmus sp. PABB004]